MNFSSPDVSITYNGTFEQWNAINHDYYPALESQYTITCLDGTFVVTPKEE